MDFRIPDLNNSPFAVAPVHNQAVVFSEEQVLLTIVILQGIQLLSPGFGHKPCYAGGVIHHGCLDVPLAPMSGCDNKQPALFIKLQM